MQEETLKKLKGKKIVFCLPGGPFSGQFLIRFHQLTHKLYSYGVETAIAHTTGSCIHRLRNQVGGGNPAYGLLQEPFNGEHYDYLLWIDSDILFSSDDFIKLFEVDKDIVSGWYMQSDGLPACGFIEVFPDKYDKRTPPFPLYDKNNLYRFFNDKEIESKTDPYVIDWVGMGWFLVKAGVMEKIKYPWFAPVTVRVSKTKEEEEHCYDSLSEDLSFQLALKEAGFDIWIDPTIRLGHEKTRVI